MTINDLVKADLDARMALGTAKYGKPLTADEPCHNGLSSLQNAYEEVLDLAMYLKKKLVEEMKDSTVKDSSQAWEKTAEIIELIDHDFNHAEVEALEEWVQTNIRMEVPHEAR